MRHDRMHLVSFSGGMGSFAEAYYCVEKYGAENVKLLFADTSMEDEDLYRFLNEAVTFLGVKLISVADGRTPFQVFKDEKFMGNSRIDPCSKILKRLLLTKTIKSLYSPNEVSVHLGIDYSECHRLPPIQARYLPYTYRSTLVEDGRIIPKSFSERYGIQRPRLYHWGLGHNNCGGFCIKAGLGHYKKLWEANPERYLKFEQEEADCYESMGSTHPFLTRTVNGVKQRITLRHYRIHSLETDTTTASERDEFGGCGCAL